MEGLTDWLHINLCYCHVVCFCSECSNQPESLDTICCTISCNLVFVPLFVLCSTTGSSERYTVEEQHDLNASLCIERISLRDYDRQAVVYYLSLLPLRTPLGELGGLMVGQNTSWWVTWVFQLRIVSLFILPLAMNSYGGYVARSKRIQMRPC